MLVAEIMICFEALLCFKLTRVIFLSRFGEDPDTLESPRSASAPMSHFLLGQDVDFVLKEDDCIEMSVTIQTESFEVGLFGEDALMKLEEILSGEAVFIAKGRA